MKNERLPGNFEFFNTMSGSVHSERNDSDFAALTKTEGEERFWTLANFFPIGIFQTDPDGNFLYVNSRWCGLAGMPEEDAGGQGWGHALTPEDREEFLPEWARVIKERGLVSGEYRYHTPEGKIVWVDVWSAPMRNDAGEITGYLGTVTDITGFKRVETGLRESVVREKAILETAVDAIITINEQGCVQSFNPAAVRLFGYAEEEIVGHNVNRLMPSPTREEHDAYLARYRSTEAPKLIGSTREVVARHKSGKSIPVELSLTEFNLGETRCFTGIIRDLTERKRAEEELAALSTQHQLILHSIEEGIYGLDLKGSITFMNPAGAHMVGWSLDELIGQHPHAILHHTKSDGRPYSWEECPIYESFRDGETHHVDTEVFWRKDGTNFPVEYTSLPIRGPDGGLMGAVVTFCDITQRREAEEKGRQTELQLWHSQKMNAIGTLAGGVAHDFNNILTAILGYTELIQLRTPHEEPVERYLHEVLAAGLRAKELVKQILTFSRQTEVRKKPVDLQTVVREALMLIRATLPTTISIREELSVSSDLVYADSTQMHQVLMNLCTNAEYAMRDQGGVLTVRLETVEEVSSDGLMHYPELIPGPHLLLTVRDTGHGMSPEVLTRIFDPFFTTKKLGEGTGMGLAVVHGIIADHQGRITVRSISGEGTTVSVVLPILAAPAALAVEEELPSAAPLQLGQGHVLLVDDEASLVALGKELLEEYGYEVTTRTSSPDALEAFRAAPSRYDVVITDQTMPNMTGEALAYEIQRIRPDIPILLCTGFSYTMTEEKARELGIRKFLMKPLLGHELVLALQEVMEEADTTDRLCDA